jgi:hypothetical protein
MGRMPSTFILMDIPTPSILSLRIGLELELKNMIESYE